MECADCGDDLPNRRSRTCYRCEKVYCSVVVLHNCGSFQKSSVDNKDICGKCYDVEKETERFFKIKRLIRPYEDDGGEKVGIIMKKIAEIINST